MNLNSNTGTNVYLVESSIRMTIDPVWPHRMLDDCFKKVNQVHIHSDFHERERSSSVDSEQSTMSGYYYPPRSSSEEISQDLVQQIFQQSSQPGPGYSSYTAPSATPLQPHQAFFPDPSQFSYQQTPPYQAYQYQQQQQWVPPTVPSNYPLSDPSIGPFPRYSEDAGYSRNVNRSEPSRTSSAGYLSPDPGGRSRNSRSTSLASNASSTASYSEVSRSTSPNVSEMLKWGSRNGNGSWSCAYPGCTSRSTFNRGCDLRKHYKRHTKTLFCRWDGCPQSAEGGFSSKKDRARHEAKHNPTIVCEWEGCDRLFSRQDNMKDHVRRVHKRRPA